MCRQNRRNIDAKISQKKTAAYNGKDLRISYYFDENYEICLEINKYINEKINNLNKNVA